MVQMSGSCADGNEMCTITRDGHVTAVIGRSQWCTSSDSVNWHKDIIKVAWSLTTNTVKRHQGDFEQNALRYWQPM